MVTQESKMGTRAFQNHSLHLWYQNMALLPILDSLLFIFSPSWTILKFFSLKEKFFLLAKEKIKQSTIKNIILIYYVFYTSK